MDFYQLSNKANRRIQGWSLIDFFVAKIILFESYCNATLNRDTYSSDLLYPTICHIHVRETYPSRKVVSNEKEIPAYKLVNM